MGYPIYHSQYTAAQIEASIGKTPRIKSSTRTWEIWDIATSAYVDTGVSIDTQLYVDPTLTESGYAADAKVTGDKIGELKSILDSISEYAYNLFDSSDATSGYRLDAVGVLTEYASGFVSDKISVLPSERYIKNSPTENSYHRVALYGEDDIFIDVTNANEFTTPKNASYIRFCGLLTELNTTELFHISTIDTTARIEAAENAANISDVKRNPLTLVQIGSTDLFSGAYINTTTGGLTKAKSQSYTDYISVSRFFELYSNVLISGYTLRYALYDNAKTFISGGTMDANDFVKNDDLNLWVYTISDTVAKYIRLSILTAFFDSNTLKYQTLTYGNKLLHQGNHGNSFLANMAVSLRTGYRVYYKETGESFSAVTISRNGSNVLEKVQLGVTNLVYSVPDYSYTETVAHGLTWADVRIAIIESTDLAHVKVTAITNGGSFTHTFDRPKGFGTYGAWESNSTNEYEIVNQISKPNDIWVVGDSYMSYADDRIGGQLYNYGTETPTIISFPGADTLEIYDELLKMVEGYKVTPKKLAVCTGMNDTLTTYTQGIAKIIALCNAYDVDIIITAIPITPLKTSDNLAVRNYALTLPYQKIRFDEAVDSNDSGVWFTGCLSADNIHPSEAGAKLLAEELLSVVGYLC